MRFAKGSFVGCRCEDAFTTVRCSLWTWKYFDLEC